MRAVSSSLRSVAETGRRVPWNYGPDDASQAIEAGCIAVGKQDGFFPASIEVHKLQTTTHTHTYSTLFVIHVNLSLPISCHFSSITRSTHCTFNQIAHFFRSFFISSHTFLHTKPLDNRSGCTFLSPKSYNNNFLCIG